MAAEGYLPPVVTKFLADLTDLVKGVATGKALIADFARTTTDTLGTAGGDAGRAFAHQFTTEIRAGTHLTMKAIAVDSANVLGEEGAKSFAGAGAKAGSSFGGSFSSLLMPILIASLVLLSPVIVTGIASAITLGIGLGFVGLGAFLLREQKPLIDAAVHFKNTVSAVFKDAAMPMLGPLVAGLNILTGMVKELGPSFKQIFGDIGGAIPNFATGIAGFMRELMPGLKELAPVAGSLISALATVMPDIGKGLGDFFSSLAKSAPGMILFIEDFGEGLGALLTNLGKATEFFSDLYVKLSRLHDKAVEEGWDTPWAAIKTGASAVGGWISSAADAVSSWFVDMGSAVTGWYDKAEGKVTGFVDRTVAWFESLPGKIGDAIAALPGVLVRAVTTAFDAFFYITSFAITRTVQLFFALPGILGNLTSRAWQAVVDMFWRGTTSTVQTVESLPHRVGAVFGLMWAAVVGWVSRTYWDAVTWVHKAVTGIVGWLDSLPGRASTALGNLASAVKKSLQDVGSWLYQSGKNLIIGLIEGVGSAIDWAIGIIKRAADRIAQGARDALGIRSPSTVFAAMGQQTVEGYVLGIRSNMGMISGAWRSMLGGAGAPRVTADMRASVGGAALAGAGGGGSDTIVVNVDGQRLLTALVPRAQDRKRATGSTGLD
ncbi:MAG TPA: hypothetical protein DGT23_22480 [Micromonosporaceae bacterium]|nr:hypothetical protein [Micromonosporaceae bacterium]